MQLLFCLVLWLREPWLGIKWKLLQYNESYEVSGRTKWHSREKSDNIFHFIRKPKQQLLTCGELSVEFSFPRISFVKSFFWLLPVIDFVLRKIETMIFFSFFFTRYNMFTSALLRLSLACYPGYLLPMYRQTGFTVCVSAIASHGDWSHSCPFWNSWLGLGAILPSISDSVQKHYFKSKMRLKSWWK